MECTSEFQTGALTGLRPSNPLGVKGAGEGAIIPVGGLMANAVANALASLGRTLPSFERKPLMQFAAAGVGLSTRWA